MLHVENSTVLQAMKAGMSNKPSRFARQAIASATTTAAPPSGILSSSSSSSAAAAAAAATAESDCYVDYDDMNLTALEIIAAASSTKNNKRKQNSMEQQLPNKLSKAAIEEMMNEKREEALGQSIATEHNKGFQLLAKVGYSKEVVGGGLGKDRQGIQQPLTIVKRMGGDRLGLGAVDPIKKQVEEALKQKQKQTVQRDQRAAHFQSNLQAQHAALKVQRLLKKAGKVVFELDSRQGITQHELEFHKQTMPKTDYCGDIAVGYDGNGESPTYEEYFAIHVNDSGPPSSGNSSSGSTSDFVRSGTSGAGVNISVTKQMEVEEIIDPNMQLEASLAYLRSTYSYCLFCGCQYEGQEDMVASCPGVTEDDHE